VLFCDVKAFHTALGMTAPRVRNAFVLFCDVKAFHTALGETALACCGAVPDRSRTTIAALVFAAVVIAFGVTVRLTTGTLGTALPPFVMSFGLRVHPLAAVAAAVLALAVAFGPRLLDRPRSGAGFAAAVFGLALACGLAVGAARRGTDGWWRVFDLGPEGSFEAKNEYLPGLPALQYGARFFLDRFAELVPSQTVNVAGHPPGLMLTMHALGIDRAEELAALCILAAAALAPLAYALARALGLLERQARVSGLLAALVPTIMLFGVTSADAVYAALAVASAALLVDRRPALRGAGFALFAVGAFFSWANLAVGVFALVVAWRREGVRPAVVVAGGCAVAWLAFNGALALATGWDPLGTLIATEGVYRESVASRRPYPYWVFGSVVAWGAMGGVATLWWLVAVRRGQAGAVALAVVIVIAAGLGFTTAETERIWLPFTGLASAAAGAVLPAERLRAALALLAGQALIVQLLFETIW
jgi:methylthioxylose transferase